jgi:hypothetical protein
MAYGSKLPFSQRIGVRPVRKALQVRSMDAPLRNRLWNTVSEFLIPEDKGNYSIRKNRDYLPFNTKLSILWHNFFKAPVDTIPEFYESAVKSLRDYFFDAPWHNVFDFLEFLRPLIDRYTNEFEERCNAILEQELSAYRFVNGLIAELTSEQEIAAIEQAINVPDPLKPVKTHLERALALMADREDPDYRNSIKESISAVESLCKLVSGEDKATLSGAIGALERKVPLHASLKRAFKELYWYSSDAQGIRHALLDEPSLTSGDAKFMLVSCSTFVNYIVELCARAGVTIEAPH